jgi:1,5-anhydro-D-fructose reductase (1,5-anhydro-D-mannitol-forming)
MGQSHKILLFAPVDPSEVRWGIIGCGEVCEVKSGPAFGKAQGSSLAAVMRRDADKARDFASRHGVPRWYADAEALIADPGVDAVYVATPPDTHAHYALLAARAGKPVYVEKPMARTHAECETMVAACRAAGVPLFVAYYRRRLPRFLKAKEILAAGGIGSIRSVQVTFSGAFPAARPGEPPPWRLVPGISGGGLFVDLACHTFDLLDFLLGPIVEARGLAANLAGVSAGGSAAGSPGAALAAGDVARDVARDSAGAAEDTVSACFAFASGALGAGAWAFSAARRSDRVEILGDSGRLAFSTFADEPIRWESGEGTRDFALANPPHVQQPLIQSIVDQLRGRGECPSTGETAARTNRVMDSILADWREESGVLPSLGLSR